MSDVQMVLTSQEYPTFAEAQANAITSVRDGDPLWAHISYPSSLAEWGSHTPDSYEQTDRDMRRISLGIGAAGGSELWREEQLLFTLEQASALKETAICLSKGMPGENRSAIFFLSTVAGGAPGVWENQIVLYRQVGYSDADAEPLAICPVTVDVAGGMTAYSRAQSDYTMDITRAEAATDRAPVEGRFFDRAMRDEMIDAIDNRGYEADHVYFTSDDWEITGGSRPEWKRIVGVFLYRKNGERFRGNVILAHQWNAVTEGWQPYRVDPVFEDGFPLDEEAAQAAPGAIDLQAELSRIRGGGAPAPATAAPASGGGDIIGQIKQLGELHAAGILTDEEFSTKKAELLARL